MFDFRKSNDSNSAANINHNFGVLFSYRINSAYLMSIFQYPHQLFNILQEAKSMKGITIILQFLIGYSIKGF